MIVKIKDEDGKRFCIPVPMWIIRLGLSRFVIKRIKKHIKDDDLKFLDTIDFKALSKSFKELKKYKGLKMVDIKSGDGESIEIII